MENEIVRGKQDMSLQEARILRLLITQVVKEDKDFKTYTCKITDLAEFLNIPKNNLYRDVHEICSDLMQRVVHIRKDKNNLKSDWKIISWLDKASCSSNNGEITLELSRHMQPYLIDLNKYFTQYQLENILQMKSFYSIRLYELLKSDFYKSVNDFEQIYTIKFLREFFDCEKKI